VNLLTYHRAKGLEFEGVFLPRLIDGEIPFRSGAAMAQVEEERRLLYVGITRARRYLFLTWPTDGRARASRFLDELGLMKAVRPAAASPRASVTVARGGALYDRLREWRRRRAQTDGVPAYVVFHDRTLVEIAERRPNDWADLAAVAGVGPAKLERYADEVLAVIATVRAG
jgi:DNA helicase-2/ATP-dependent DNA helicase PcrA